MECSKPTFHSPIIPNGTGPFVIQLATFSANNDGITGTSPNSESGFALYPNPAKTRLFIKGLEGVESYEILDIAGKSVSSGSTASNSAIDISGLSSGLYFLRCNSGNSRFIVSR
ncbi:MAG: T9SS type A sorting domain-containing protein [Bacteroidia bacterium]